MESKYVVIDGQKVFLSEEQMKIWNRFINTTRHNARKYHQCAQADFRKCNGDCQQCKWYRCGDVVTMPDELTLSLVTTNTSTSFLKDTASSPEQIVIYNETLSRLLDFADRIFPEAKQGRQILSLYLEYEMTLSSISAETGIPVSTVADRLQKMLECIRKNRKKFFETD